MIAEEGSERVSVNKQRIAPSLMSRIEGATRRKIRLSMAIRRKVLRYSKAADEKEGPATKVGRMLKTDESKSSNVNEENIDNEQIPLRNDKRQDIRKFPVQEIV